MRSLSHAAAFAAGLAAGFAFGGGCSPAAGEPDGVEIELRAVDGGRAHQFEEGGRLYTVVAPDARSVWVARVR